MLRPPAAATRRRLALVALLIRLVVFLALHGSWTRLTGSHATCRDVAAGGAPAEEADAGEVARARFLEIARRRASHFAHFTGDGGEARGRDEAGATPGAAPASEEREEWPGPFSTARRLVAGRAAAAAAREDAALAGRDGQEIKKRPVVAWAPTRGLDDLPRRPPGALRSLFEMCMALLVTNVDYVESMRGVPDVVRRRLAAALCSRRKMGPKSLALLFEGAPTEVAIPDCSFVTEVELTHAMAQCSTDQLEVLELGMCGRCLSDQGLAATICAAPGSMPRLASLSLRGGYRLSDVGLLSILRAAPCLESVELRQCSLVTEAGIDLIAVNAGDRLVNLSLEDCGQLDGMKLVGALVRLPKLRRLALSGVANVSDVIVEAIVGALGPSLEDLKLANCSQLTDRAIMAIGNGCPSLASLQLDHLTLLSDEALRSIADGCRHLRAFSARRCRFSDEAIAAFVTASGGHLRDLSLNSCRQASDLTLVALATHAKGSLERLDLSWCRDVSDEALGLLADSCPLLRRLNLFGCSQVSKTFLIGHSNDSLTVAGRGDEIIA
eukprot:SM000002S05702  [mRNA]  locus=s2:1777468:1780750:+ [translate_table: standard]